MDRPDDVDTKMTVTAPTGTLSSSYTTSMLVC